MVNYRNYIVVDGIPGVGKTSQIENLQIALRKRSVTAILLGEPTYSLLGQKARKLLGRGSRGDANEEVLALRQDREDHVRCKVRPLLSFVARNPGFLIVQDRSYLSSPVFQGLGDIERMRRLVEEERLIAEPPDLTLVLDASVSTVKNRIDGRKKTPSKFESTDQLEGQRKCFLELKTWVEEKIEVIDASGDIEDVTQLMLKALEAHGLVLPEPGGTT